MIDALKHNKTFKVKKIEVPEEVLKKIEGAIKSPPLSTEEISAFIEDIHDAKNSGPSRDSIQFAVRLRERIELASGRKKCRKLVLK